MKPLNEKTFRELCLLHALGKLDPGDEARLIDSLADADEARLEFFAETAGQAQLETASGPVLPGPEVKRKLAGLVGFSAPDESNAPRASQTPAPRASHVPHAPFRPGAGSPRTGFRRALAFAALVIGAGLFAFSALQWRRAEKSQAALLGYQALFEALQDSLEVKEALLAVLASPQVKLASLKTGGPAAATLPADVSGRVYWDGAGLKGVLHVSALPPAPEGKAYYLWILVDDKADPCVNAGTFAVRRLRPEGDFFRFEGAEGLSRLKVLGFEITAENLRDHPHEDGHEHEHDHLHPTGKTLLKSEILM